MKLTKSNLNEFLKLLTSGYQVYAPVLKDGVPEFSVYKEGDQMFLEGFNTVKPPKDILFPDYEEM